MAVLLGRQPGGSGGGGGGPPSGAAGGSLAGTYPNPTIAANAVDSAQIAADAVGTSEIAANAVGASELADNAVDTNAIANNAVTAAKVAADVATQAELDAVTALAYWDAVIRKAVTESVASSTVVQADDELFFPVTNGVAYEFRAFIVFDEPNNSGTPDFKWRFAPASGSEISFRQHVGVSLAFAAQTAAVLDAVDVTNGADGNKRSVLVQGGYTAFANTNYQFMWAQNTSSVNAVRVLAGSTLSYRALD